MGFHNMIEQLYLFGNYGYLNDGLVTLKITLEVWPLSVTFARPLLSKFIYSLTLNQLLWNQSGTRR